MKYLNRITNQEPEVDVVKKLQSGGTAVRIKTTSGKTVAAYGRKEDAYRAIESEKKADVARKKLAESNKKPAKQSKSAETKKVVQKSTTQSTNKPSVKQPVKQTNTPQPTIQKKTSYLGSQSNPKQLPEATIIGKAKQVEGLSGGNITASLKPKGEVNQKVVEWQKKLKAEGFDLGEVDGKWGKKTEAAYQAYLKNKQALEKVGLPQDNAPFVSPRQGFPTPQNAYFKEGGTFKYLQKGGKVNGKTAPKDNDENVIPTKNEGGTDMNPKFWKKDKPKLQPKKENKKEEPIYKPKVKKDQQGGKLNLNFTGLPSVNNSVINGAADPANAKLNFNWGTMKQTNLTFPTTKTNQTPTLTRTITNYLPKTKLQNDTVYGGNDLNGEYYSFNKTDNPQEYSQMRSTFNKFLTANQTQVANRKKGGMLNKGKKCSCGCSMKISKNEKGGLIEACSCKCGGKLKKKK